MTAVGRAQSQFRRSPPYASLHRPTAGTVLDHDAFTTPNSHRGARRACRAAAGRRRRCRAGQRSPAASSTICSTAASSRAAASSGAAAAAQPRSRRRPTAADVDMRIDRIENALRQLTGTIEQLQYRQPAAADAAQAHAGRHRVPLAAARRRAAGAAGARAAAAHGRRSDAFDPSQRPQCAARAPAHARRRVRSRRSIPNAPAAPRALGQRADRRRAASMPPTPPVGAPGGRAAGAPLDLSTLSAAADAAPPQADGERRRRRRSRRAIAAAAAAQSERRPARSSRRCRRRPRRKDEYDLAYGYVLHKDYALAEQAFRDFLRKYPNDRLVPDAQYWLGESLFQRQRYRDAAESFLAVSTKYEHAGKAPDALLRLGQSLAALNQKEAACATLGRSRPQISARLGQREARRRRRNRSVRTAERSERRLSAAAEAAQVAVRRVSPIRFPALVLAVSGGPDSTALMVLAARWRKALKRRPEADRRHRRSRPAHGSASARRRRWQGSRASSASRIAPCAGPARSRRPACSRRRARRATACWPSAARKAGAAHILTAHTLDDQAETVLIRMSRGSGITGLARDGADLAPCRASGEGDHAGAPVARHPQGAADRHAASAAKIAFADDPSNRDPRFTRARLRGLMPRTGARGPRRRAGWRCWRAGCKRADAAIEAAVDRAEAALAPADTAEPAPIAFDAAGLCPPAGRDRAAAARPRGRRDWATRARSNLASWRRSRRRSMPPKTPAMRAVSPHPGRRACDARRRPNHRRTGAAARGAQNGLNHSAERRHKPSQRRKSR